MRSCLVHDVGQNTAGHDSENLDRAPSARPATPHTWALFAISEETWTVAGPRLS